MNNNPLSLMTRRGEYRVRNAAGSSSVTEILVYDEIGEDSWFGGGISAKQFTEDLAAIDTDEIHLRINSPGGNVFEGITMLNAIRRHPAKVTAYVDGMAASAASFLAMGADEVVMSRNSQMMIHDASGIAIGNAEVMHDVAARLDKASDNIAAIYAGKAGGSAEDWRTAMKAEAWYTDEEAVEAGLADRVDTNKTASDKATNKFNLSLFAYSGRAAAPAPYLPAKPPETTNQEGPDIMPDALNLRERLGLKAEASDEEVAAKLDAVLKNSDPDPEKPGEETEAEETDETEDEAPAAETPGVVQVDEQTLNNLKRDAEAGRKAFEAQQAQRREELVNAALRDGRISADRKQDWLNTLEKDPGSEKTLANLAKVVPVGSSQGYTGGLAETGDDDEYYNLFPDEKPQNKKGA